MKILKTLLVSGLISFSLSSTAADFDKRNEEMNRLLQQRIDASVKLSKWKPELKPESVRGVEIKSEFAKVSFEPKLPAHRS